MEMHNSGNLPAPGTSDGGSDANREAGVHDAGRGISAACSLSHLAEGQGHGTLSHTGQWL